MYIIFSPLFPLFLKKKKSWSQLSGLVWTCFLALINSAGIREKRWLAREKRDLPLVCVCIFYFIFYFPFFHSNSSGQMRSVLPTSEYCVVCMCCILTKYLAPSLHVISLYHLPSNARSSLHLAILKRTSNHLRIRERRNDGEGRGGDSVCGGWVGGASVFCWGGWWTKKVSVRLRGQRMKRWEEWRGRGKGDGSDVLGLANDARPPTFLSQPCKILAVNCHSSKRFWKTRN